MTELTIDGVVLEAIESYEDERGSFREIFRSRALPVDFVQANHSNSAAGVLRGLHYHRYQSDLWYLVRGSAQVVMVDLRTRSDPPPVTTLTMRASAERLFIPAGVAHGYLALEEIDLIYWVSREYDPSDEHGIAWDDPALEIEWARSDVVVSDRDRRNPRLRWEDIPRF